MTYDAVRHHADMIQAYADENYDGDWEKVTVGETRGILFTLCHLEDKRR
jgi:hypothetical protein